MKRKIIYLTFISVLLLAITSCRKYLDVGPPAVQLTGETVFNNDATATSALLAIYSLMESSGLAYNAALTTGTASDEFNNHRTALDAVGIATNNITPENGTILTLWSSNYNYIYQANAIIEGLSRNNGVSLTVRSQLLGEAYFIRAWCHFLLVNYFGNIPYYTSTNYEENLASPQQNISEVLPKIIEDLLRSKGLLQSFYVGANNLVSSERTRPNKYAAHALLAKIYLYNKQWSLAELESDSVISQPAMYSLLSNLNSVFLKNNSEVLWQLQATVPAFNSVAGGYLQPTTTTPSIVSLTKNLIDSFESGDLRKAAWVKSTTVSTQTYYWIYKYKVGQNASSITEYTIVSRLAELIFIRAEARAMQDKFLPALNDLNLVRVRAGLPIYTIPQKEIILHQLFKERRMELFGELNDRWLELKRTQRINTILPVIKGSNWSPTDQLFPIPLNEMLRHPGMLQNPGY
jgi:hypothetical protein